MSNVFNVDQVDNKKDYSVEKYTDEIEDSFKKVLDLFLSDVDQTCKNKNCVSCQDDGEDNCINRKLFDAVNDFIKIHYRIPYAMITQQIYSIDDDKYDIFTNRASICINCLKDIIDNTQTEEAKEHYKMLLKSFVKIIDHINLASSQKELFDDINSSVSEAKDILEEIPQKTDDSLKRLKNKVDELTNNISNQLISIVGIFVAVAFVMFGGMTLLNNLFDYSRMNYIPIIEMLCLGSLIGLIIVDAIYAFILMVFYLTNKHEQIKEQKFMKKLIHRLNVVLIIFIVITSVLWWFDVKNTYGYEENVSGCQVIDVNKETNEYTLKCKGNLEK